MADNEFTPSEYLKLKRYTEAKQAFGKMNMNESQITYLAYNLLNKKPYDLQSVRTILELAEDQHPKSSMVYSRWGEFYLKSGNHEKAIESYKKAVTLDPNDQVAKESLDKL
jgi:tetratricopeptide (TPR) repeat protein